jgi:hypothetical protein
LKIKTQIVMKASAVWLVLVSTLQLVGAQAPKLIGNRVLQHPLTEKQARRYAEEAAKRVGKIGPLKPQAHSQIETFHDQFIFTIGAIRIGIHRLSGDFVHYGNLGAHPQGVRLRRAIPFSKAVSTADNFVHKLGLDKEFKAANRDAKATWDSLHKPQIYLLEYRTPRSAKIQKRLQVELYAGTGDIVYAQIDSTIYMPLARQQEIRRSAAEAAKRISDLRRRGLKAVFTPAAVRTVMSADRMEVYRIDTSGTGARVRRDANKISGPVKPSAKWMKKFKAALADKSNHGWGISFKCGFDPGVMVRAYKGAKFADVLFCYKCGELAIVLPTENGISHKQSMGKGASKYLSLFIAVMPKDRALLSLINHLRKKH